MERGIRHEAGRRQDFEFTAVPAAAWGPPTGEGMKLSHLHAMQTLISPKAQKRLGTLFGVVGPAEPQSSMIEGNTNPIRPGLDQASTILHTTVYGMLHTEIWNAVVLDSVTALLSPRRRRRRVELINVPLAHSRIRSPQTEYSPIFISRFDTGRALFPFVVVSYPA